MTQHTLASIQQPAPICNCFFRIKKHKLEELFCRCQLGNKDSKYSFKQYILNFPIFLQYNFSKDEMFKEETLSSKNTAKFYHAKMH